MYFEEPYRLSLGEEWFLSAFGQGQETRDLGWPNAISSLERFHGNDLQPTTRDSRHHDSELFARELKQYLILRHNPACRGREAPAQTYRRSLRFIDDYRAKPVQEAHYSANSGFARYTDSLPSYDDDCVLDANILPESQQISGDPIEHSIILPLQIGTAHV